RLAGRVSRNEIEPLDGNKEFRVIGVNEQHELARHSAGRDRLQTLKTPNAMIDMNDKITLFEIAKIGNESAEIGLAPLRPVERRRSVRLHRLAENIRLGVNGETSRG